MLLCRKDCINLNILHRHYPKPLSWVRSVSFASSKAHSPLDKASASSCGTFLRDVYIPIKPSADQFSVVEAAIVAEFEVIFHHDEILRRMIGPDMVIRLRDDAVPFYVTGNGLSLSLIARKLQAC
jgi:hypothetical protein